MGYFNDKWMQVNNATRGYLFMDKYTERIYRPHEVLCKFFSAETDLEYNIELLCKKEHPDYEAKDCFGWKDGEYLNIETD